MKLIALIGLALSFSVSAQPALLHVGEFELEYEIAGNGEHDVDILRAINLEEGNRQIEEIKLADMVNGMSNQYLDFWSKRPLPDYPQIRDIPVTVITSVQKIEEPTNLFFTDQGRVMWGELWHEWASDFPQGRSVLTEKSGHFIQFDEPELVLNELLLLMQKLDKH